MQGFDIAILLLLATMVRGIQRGPRLVEPVLQPVRVLDLHAGDNSVAH
jgi:hypothetical protein